MSDVAYDVIIWLDVVYRNPAKTSTFGPYANLGLDKSFIRAINQALNESPNFEGIHGLSCHDAKGNIHFTIFVKRETNAAVAGKLRTRSEYSTLTLYRVQVTDWWPKIHLNANGSLEGLIKERLDDDGIRLQKNDVFETWLSQEGAMARGQAQLHGEPAVGRYVVPVQLVDGILAGMVTVAGYVWRTQNGVLSHMS